MLNLIKPDISIIIVNYYSFKMLENCLSSLINYSNGIEYELIVVDNTPEENYLLKIKEKYPHIIFIENKINKGFAAANNQGIKIAKGKYLLFLNNDTIFHENTLEKIFHYSENNKDSVMLGCKLLNEDYSWQKSFFDFPSPFNSFTSNLFLYKLFPRTRANKYNLFNKHIDYTSEVDVVIGAFLFVSSESIKHIGEFDERFYFYAEEMDLCYRFKKSGGKIYYFPKTSIIHLGGASVDKVKWFKYKNEAIATIQFFQKNYSGISYLIAVAFHYIGLLIRIPLHFFLGIFLLHKDYLVKSYFQFKQLFIYPKNKFKNPGVLFF